MDIEYNEIVKIVERVNSNSSLIAEIVDSLLEPYISEIDDLMKDSKDLHRLDIHRLNELILQFPPAIQNATLGLKELEINYSASHRIRDNEYNLAYVASSGRIADREAIAKLNSINSEVVKSAYNIALKHLKDKIDGLKEQNNNLKKIYSYYENEWKSQNGRDVY